jgi:hypothetical protein
MNGGSKNLWGETKSFHIFPSWIWIVLICYLSASTIFLNFSEDNRKKYDSVKTLPWWWWVSLICVSLIAGIGPIFSD